ILSQKTGGTLTFTGGINLTTLTLNGPGSTLNLGTSVSHIINGNLIVTAGTLNGGSASITIQSGADQNIAGFTTTGSVTMTKTAGTATFTGNVSAGALNLSGAGGTLNLGNSLTHTFSGTWTRTNGTLNGGSSTLNFTATGSFITGVTGSFIPGTGTVNYAAAGNQEIGPFTYNNLTISGSGVKTVITATVNGVLSMEGTATLSAPVTYGTLATLRYNRSTAFTTTANEFPNTFTPSGGVVIANSGTITLNASKTLSGALTINAGATLDLNGFNTHSCFGLVLGGITQSAIGTYGRTGSGADNFNDVSFAGTSGRITLNSITTSWLGLSFDWSDPTNWTNGVPTSVSDVTVSTGVPNQPLISTASETRSLTINAGASLTSAGMQLSVYGNLVNNGTLGMGAGQVVISGTTAQSIDGFTTTGNLVVTKLGGIATLNGNISVHDVTISGAGGTLNLGTANTHTISGNLNLSAGAIDGGSSDVVFTGASAQNASGFTTTGNITSSKTGGSLAFTSGFECTDFTMSGAGTTVFFGTAVTNTITGNLTINSGSLDAASSTIRLGGDLVATGTFDADACNLVLIGLNDQSIPGFTTTGNLRMEKDGGVATLGGAVNAAGLTLDGPGGTLHLGSSLTHTFTGDVSLLQGILQGGNNTIRVSSNSATAWDGDGSVFEAGTGTVIFNGNDQTINTSTTFNNLTLSGAGAKTFASGTTTNINGVHTIANGSSVNVFTGATIAYGSTAALVYNAGAASRTVSAEWPASFSSTGGITINGTAGGIITLNGNKVIGNNNNTHLTINAGATLATNNFAVTLHGNLVQSGTLTAGSSNFTVAGTNATQSIDGFTTTGTLSLTKTAGTATLNGNINAGALTINGSGGTLNMGTGRTHTIGGNVTLTAGTLTAGNNTLNINGSGASVWSGNGTLFSRGTSSVVFGGSAPTISVSTDFHNLSFSGTGTAVAPAALSVSGNLVANQAVNFTTAGNTLTFDGTSPQTVSGTSNPAFVNVTVNSTGNVQLATSASASGNVVLQSGDLLLSTQQLTVTGNITRTTGKLGAGSGTLVLNGSSSQSLPATLFIGDSIRNLTMNNAAGVVLNSATRLTGNFTPTAGTLATNNFLTVGSTAAGTARVLAGSSAGGYITGTVKVERYVPGSRRNWRFMSSPATSTTLADWQNEMHITGPGGAANGFDATTYNRGSVFVYDETDLATANSGDKNIGWVSATNTTNSLLPGRGYRVFVRGDRNPGRLDGTVQDQSEITLDLNGTLNQGSISLPVTCTFSGPGSTFSASNDGWNLVGNPYACDYDWDDFWTNNNSNATRFLNLESDIWIFDPVASNYVTYNALTNTGTGQLINGIIPSGAAFWVKANNTAPVLQLVEASKTASNPGNLFKNDRPDKAFRIVLNDVNSVDADEAAVLYHEKATRASDIMDVTKMSGSANIAVLTDDGKLTTINSRPAIIHGDTIPLAISAVNGRYSISFRNIENLHTSLDAVLVDYTTRSVIDVRSTPAYVFDVTQSSADSYDKNRFKILIGAKGQLPEPGNYGISLENAVSVYPNPAKDDVYIRQLGGLEIQSAIVLDVNGRTQLTIPYINSTKFQVDIRDWKPGVYFVETTDVKGNVLKHKLIKH
ncbi:MAG: T9SS type A sorting domain-containing protein, partial [Bacteroidota bacterium]